MTRCDLQEPFEDISLVGPALDREEINDLNEKFCVALACFANRLNQLLQSGQESIVTDAQQRAAGDVANAGRFDDQRRRVGLQRIGDTNRDCPG